MKIIFEALISVMIILTSKTTTENTIT